MKTVKSVLFRRVLLILCTALLLSITCAVAAYRYIGESTYISIETSGLEPRAQVLGRLYLEYRDGNLSGEALTAVLREETDAGKCAVLIFDRERRETMVGNLGNEVKAEDFSSFFTDRMEDVLNGESVTDDALTLQSGESAVGIGHPLRNGEDGILGAVFIIKPLSLIRSAYAGMQDMFGMILVLMLSVALLMGAWGTNRVSRPILEMADVANSMANGNFEIRANAEESGELGELARALNTLCDNLSTTILQLRNEKRQLDHLLQSLTDGVAAVDGEGNLTHFNPALKDMFGVVSCNTPMELVPDESIWDTFREVQRTGEGQTLHYTMPGDRMLWISVVPVTDENGFCSGAVGLFKDVTEFERLEKTRRDYVANVSHELRTPLTAVRGLLEPLADGMVKDEETRDRYYRIMLHEVQRLSRLITDLLQLSRLQSGTEYMQITNVDVAELLEEICENYRNEATRKGITLKTSIQENLPHAMTDADRVEQILVILVDNAMRYTPEGGTITLSGVCTDHLLIGVTDTGCGVSQEDLPHLFDRFYKADKSRREGGTGLGLSIVHQIMENLGEEIYVESTLGEGTAFHFTLKKYVNNAIALGPSGSGVRYEGEEEQESGDEASFEVLEPPRKSGSSEFSKAAAAVRRTVARRKEGTSSAADENKTGKKGK